MLPAHRIVVGSLVAVVGFGCSNGGSAKRVNGARVGDAGALVADPARRRGLVTDVDLRRLIGFDVDTGQQSPIASLASPPEGVTGDALGERVFITLPTLHRIQALDATTFEFQSELAFNFAVHQLDWRDHGRVVVASDAGLLLADIDARGARTIVADAGPDARIVHDADHRRVFAAFTRNGMLTVATLDPSLTGVAPLEVDVTATTLGPVGLGLSLDETKLFVGCSQPPGIFVLDSTTLALQQSIPAASLVAMSVNPTATRLYASDGHASVFEMALDSFDLVDDFDTTVEVVPFGATIDSTGGHMLLHLADASIRTLPVFASQIVGLPILKTGEPYSMTIEGPANGRFFLLFALKPGFLPFGRPSVQPRPFLDLDVASTRILLQGGLDASGKATFSGNVATGAGFGHVRFILQALVSDPAPGSVAVQTNPLFITIHDPTNP